MTQKNSYIERGSTLRIGLGLDGVLSNTDSHFKIWKLRMGWEVEDYLHSKVVREESFWRSIPPYSDVRPALRRLATAPVEVVVLTERPPRLVPITAAWLRVAGLPEATVVPLAIKRYDCRLLDVSVLLDSDAQMLKTFVYDKTDPVYIDRSRTGGFLNGRIRNEDYLDEAVEHVLSADNLLRYRRGIS